MACCTKRDANATLARLACWLCLSFAAQRHAARVICHPPPNASVQHSPPAPATTKLHRLSR